MEFRKALKKYNARVVECARLGIDPVTDAKAIWFLMDVLRAME